MFGIAVPTSRCMRRRADTVNPMRCLESEVSGAPIFKQSGIAVAPSFEQRIKVDGGLYNNDNNNNNNNRPNKNTSAIPIFLPRRG